MNFPPVNAVKETSELAVYLEGFAAGRDDKKLARAAEWMKRLSQDVCGQGYINCRGGENCRSDHK